MVSASPDGIHVPGATKSTLGKARPGSHIESTSREPHHPLKTHVPGATPKRLTKRLGRKRRGSRAYVRARGSAIRVGSSDPRSLRSGGSSPPFVGLQTGCSRGTRHRGSRLQSTTTTAPRTEAGSRRPAAPPHLRAGEERAALRRAARLHIAQQSAQDHGHHGRYVATGSWIPGLWLTRKAHAVAPSVRRQRGIPRGSARQGAIRPVSGPPRRLGGKTCASARSRPLKRLYGARPIEPANVPPRGPATPQRAGQLCSCSQNAAGVSTGG